MFLQDWDGHAWLVLQLKENISLDLPKAIESNEVNDIQSMFTMQWLWCSFVHAANSCIVHNAKALIIADAAVIFSFHLHCFFCPMTRLLIILTVVLFCMSRSVCPPEMGSNPSSSNWCSPPPPISKCWTVCYFWIQRSTCLRCSAFFWQLHISARRQLRHAIRFNNQPYGRLGRNWAYPLMVSPFSLLIFLSSLSDAELDPWKMRNLTFY